MYFQELDSDQRRELVNTQQRYLAWKRAEAERARFKGSMVWNADKGIEYLVRSDYDKKTGIRRQRSLGRRSPATEEQKRQFDDGRDKARTRHAEIEAVLKRQAALNRAVGLGRVPLLGARIIRALGSAGLLGTSIRIVGTNAIYAYEAAAGVFVEASLTATEDIDLLFDARRRIGFASTDDLSERTIMSLLRRIDRSFERDKSRFRAVNREGYLVDFIKPLPNPPWAEQREQISNGQNSEDLIAAGMHGLQWLESAPPFEAMAIDEAGMPLTIVAPDPRAFAVHKLWLSGRPDRPAVKRQRDRLQAEAVAQLVARYLLHLPFEETDLTAIPLKLVHEARPLFRADGDERE